MSLPDSFGQSSNNGNPYFFLFFVLDHPDKPGDDIWRQVMTFTTESTKYVALLLQVTIG
jgi:hypothetical protein